MKMGRVIPRVDEVLARLPRGEEENASSGEVSGGVHPVVSQEEMRALSQRVKEMEAELLRQRKEDQWLAHFQGRLRRQNEERPSSLPQAVRVELAALRACQQEQEGFLQSLREDIQTLRMQLTAWEPHGAMLRELRAQLQRCSSRLESLEKQTLALTPREHLSVELATRLSQRIDRVQKRLIALEVQSSAATSSERQPHLMRGESHEDVLSR